MDFCPLQAWGLGRGSVLLQRRGVSSRPTLEVTPPQERLSSGIGGGKLPLKFRHPGGSRHCPRGKAATAGSRRDRPSGGHTSQSTESSREVLTATPDN